MKKAQSKHMGESSMWANLHWDVMSNEVNTQKKWNGSSLAGNETANLAGCSGPFIS